MAPLAPDRYFSRVSSIDIRRDLLDEGMDTVLLDIDNTIRSRVDGEVPRDVRAWLEACAAAQLKVCLLSNNWHANVHDLAAELSLPVVGKAMKPLPPGYLVALSRMGSRARSTVVVGDQLFTDIVGARVLGLRTYMVAPLCEVDLPHMTALRGLERLLAGQSDPHPTPEPATYR